MKMRKTALLMATVMVLVTVLTAVPSMTAQASYVDDFLATVGPMCTNDMRDNHILASFTLAQAIWESGWGRSTLAVNANNLFGIRAYKTWDGKIYDRNECVLYSGWDELIAAKGDSYVDSHTNSFWRAYDSWQDSVNDHSGLFNGMSIYANLRENYDYRSCCKLIVEDGYCSDPDYTDSLIGLIESYDLEQYNYDFGNGGNQGGGASDGATSVTLKPAKLYMETGLTYDMELSVSPASADFTLKSSNTAVVTVSGKKLSAKGAGTATVTLSAGDLAVKCAVTVKNNYGGIVADGVYVYCSAKSGTVTVPDEATSISAKAFSSSSITSVIVGDGVKSVEAGAFSGMGGGFTLCSYGNRVVSDYAAANAISHVNINTGWELSSSSSLISGISLYTTAGIVTTHYQLVGITASVVDQSGKPLSSNSFVGTGCTVVVNSKEYKAIIKGDTNGDGITSTSDLLTLKGYLGGDSDFLPSRPYRKAADYNGDERITTADYLAIYRTFEG